MISFLTSLALAAAAVDAQPPGTLVGCAFSAEGATQERPSFVGLGIYLAPDQLDGPIPAAQIEDPNGFIGPSGFDSVDERGGSIWFRGKNSLELQDSGGGIFKARLNGVTMSGSCQIGHFPDRNAAFAFLDEFIQGLNRPEW